MWFQAEAQDFQTVSQEMHSQDASGHPVQDTQVGHDGEAGNLQIRNLFVHGRKVLSIERGLPSRSDHFRGLAWARNSQYPDRPDQPEVEGFH